MDTAAYTLFAKLLETNAVENIKESMRQQILQDIENANNPEEAWQQVQNLKYLSQFWTHLDMNYTNTKAQKERDQNAQAFESPVR